MVMSHTAEASGPAATTHSDGLYSQLARAASRAGGDHPAVVGDGVTLTYADLLRAAHEFCERLTTAGVKSGDRIGVLLTNEKEFLIAAFGAWKHGAVVTALNPQLRPDELAVYLLDSSVCILVANSRSKSMITVLRSRGVPIEHVWLCSSGSNDWLYEHDRMRSLPNLGLDQAAVTQYSTGSTGRPKSVTRSHTQLIGEARSVAGVLRIATDDRVLGAAPLFHSYGLSVAALATLLSGGTLYVIDTFLPGNVGRLISDEHLTGLPGVPFMFRLLAEHKEPLDLSSLRFALSAGAPLMQATARSFQARYGRAIRQLYGSTETGVICISRESGSEDDANLVGPAIPGVHLEVVDDAHYPTPPDRDGLIKITSEFAACDYDGPCNPESHFINGSFVPGDLGRITAAGDLLLRGRRRGFINVNGLKVDPCEVESALLEVPGVTEAVVIGIVDELAGEMIKAVLVSKADINEKTVRAHCLQRLAPFKCPQIIEFRSELPKNRLGKVLRQYLME